MSLSSRSARLAYIIYGAILLLVIGALTWATVASLRLRQAERRSTALRERHNRLRLAMYQMENWANPMLFSEFQRDYHHYAPFYFPDTEEVRLATGELLMPGAVIQPSPLLLAPPRQDWILLHFQASPRSGYRSPQLIPEEARLWPGFEEYDTWDRTPYAATLAALEQSVSVEDLVRKYEAAAAASAELTDYPTPPGETASGALVADASGTTPSDYDVRRRNASQVQSVNTPAEACAPQQLAVANIHSPERLDESLVDDATPPEELSEVGILYEKMVPVWIKLVGRPSADLAFLRSVDVDGEIVLQGFLVDWPKFSHELQSRAAHLFPNAEIEILDTAPVPSDDNVLSIIPARLVTHEVREVAVAGWDTTHTFLLIGWLATILLLAALGLGIRSLITLSERRSQFAYAVTHELRTPLTTFRLYTDMLAQGLVSEESRQEYLNTLNRESRRLANLVTGVLEYSRVENKAVPITRSKTAVGDVLAKVKESCGPRCEEGGAILRIDNGQAAGQSLLTDQQFVVQILSNLVDNACKYGKKDGVADVTLKAGQSNGQIWIDVIDQGPGVPPHLHSRIFRPYQRGSADPASATGGIGLGLALSRSWARRLGGDVQLLATGRESGARFRLTLPSCEG